MKKFTLFFAAFTLMGGAMISCANSGNADKEQKDSTTQTDSVAEVVNEAQDAEQARLDSIRQDSIANAQAEEFYKALPDPTKIVWQLEAGQYLSSLGFKGSTKGQEDEREGNYTLTMGDKTCKVHFSLDSNEGEAEITIDGDEAALDKYYKRALKMRATYEEGGTDVTKKGNKIIIHSYGG